MITTSVCRSICGACCWCFRIATAAGAQVLRHSAFTGPAPPLPDRRPACRMMFDAEKFDPSSMESRVLFGYSDASWAATATSPLTTSSVSARSAPIASHATGRPGESGFRWQVVARHDGCPAGANRLRARGPTGSWAGREGWGGEKARAGPGPAASPYGGSSWRFRKRAPRAEVDIFCASAAGRVDATSAVAGRRTVPSDGAGPAARDRRLTPRRRRSR